MTCQSEPMPHIRPGVESDQRSSPGVRASVVKATKLASEPKTQIGPPAVFLYVTVDTRSSAGASGTSGGALRGSGLERETGMSPSSVISCVEVCQDAAGGGPGGGGRKAPQPI